ncbi:hypothetical protein THTE_1637 [Thermogutta terrifontis]|uniref:DUF1559 domain-containing protein n=1 Tax=Thermogutta terrifontis TaxID=1331910 RepID=A0A286RE48_9BACT|nr:DUF1559 domain-containing protein [Thermogutta terrifontis]ASV74239.1 hypothetical protein THTE_1637 [Thermogutta terrifontis]
MQRKNGRGFTLIELLVVIAIIGILVALGLPAIQASRETARRAQCSQNLSQIGLALSRYYAGYECFPAGVVNDTSPIRNEPVGRHIGWVCPLLPYLDAEVYYRKLDLSKSVHDPRNDAVRTTTLSPVVCPSFPRTQAAAAKWAPSNYAGCYHHEEAPIDSNTQGALVLNRWLKEDDFPDGVTYTLFVSEKGVDPDDLGWASGTRATLRNTGSPPSVWGARSTVSSPPEKKPGAEAERPQQAAEKAANNAVPSTEKPSPLFVGGFSTMHPAVIQVLMGMQSVKPIGLNVDPRVWRQLAHRADGALPEMFEP